MILLLFLELIEKSMDQTELHMFNEKLDHSEMIIFYHMLEQNMELLKMEVNIMIQFSNTSLDMEILTKFELLSQN